MNTWNLSKCLSAIELNGKSKCNINTKGIPTESLQNWNYIIFSSLPDSGAYFGRQEF